MSDNCNSDQTLESYKIIFESSLDAILLTHPDGTIFYANSAVENLYGYTQQEICNLGRIGIVDTNDPNLQVIMDERARLGKSKGELTLIKKDGSQFPAEISTSLFKDENGNANTFTTIRDITHRKQNEKQIEYHALLLSKVNDAVIGADSNFIITYWNNGAELMFGFTGKEAIGKSSVELLRPIYAPGEREIIINELKNKGNSKSTISTKHRNGTEIIVEVNSSRILDEQKDISGYVVVYRDITERKHVEKQRKELLESEQQLVEELQHQGEGLVKINQALLESEKRMNRSQEIAHLGSWELDINNNCLSWSDEVYRIFGLQPQEFDATYETFLDNIHPNDRDAVNKAYSDSISEGKDTYEIEHRIVRKNTNEIRIVHEKCEHLRDSSGRIVRSVGMVHDITEHKKAQENLKESEERLRLAQTLGNVGIWDWNTITDELHFTPELEHLYGLIPGTIKTYQDWRQLTHPDDIEKIEAERDIKIAKNQPFDLEFRIFHNSGEIHWLSAKGGAIYDNWGNLLRVLGVNTDITDRKHAELLTQNLLESEQQLTEELTTSNEELHQQEDKLLQTYNELKTSEERFKSIIENIQDAYVRADKKGTIIMASPSAARMYRFNSTQEMIGTSTPSYFKNSEDRDFAIEQLKKNGKFTDYEVEARRNDGTFFWASQNAQYYYDDKGKILGSETIVRDITKHKKAEEALVVSEKRYRKLFNSMTEMFQVIELIYDTKGVPIDYFYRDVNPAFCRLVAKTKEELIDKRVKNIFGIVEEYWLGKYDTVAKTGNPIQFENYGAELDKWYEVNVWKVMENQVAIIFTDTTERKHREEKEKKFIDELKRSNQELERFAYVSSHDLQEPLRMVTLYSQLLERRYKDSLDSDADDFIEYIVDNAKRMKQLIDDLLEYSRVTSQAKEFENVDLEKVLDLVLANLSVSIVENNANVTHAHLPIVIADQNQMLQVFQNLINNAIKFQGKKSPEINISAQKCEKEWIFGVSDNGIGIKPEHQKQIFDVFKRLHNREEYPGTGIGLSIVQKIILQHGGRIWVESELGTGSTFYFTIPIN